MRGQFSACCATAAPSAAGEMLIRSRFSGAEQAVPPEIAALLDQCRPFRTIEDHVAFIARDRPGNPPALRALHSCLESFIRAGFLVSSTDLLDWAAKRGESSSPCRVETITIPSCNRSKSLSACLRSFDRHHRQLGRVATFVVADDARDADVSAATLAALHALSAESISIRYSNRAMRRRFAGLLAQHVGVRRDLLEFALCGLDEVPAHGSACTALILDTVGEAFVQVDDDVLCRTARALGAQSGIEVAARGDATQNGSSIPRIKLLPGYPRSPKTCWARTKLCWGGAWWIAWQIRPRSRRRQVTRRRHGISTPRFWVTWRGGAAVLASLPALTMAMRPRTTTAASFSAATAAAGCLPASRLFARLLKAARCSSARAGPP